MDSNTFQDQENLATEMPQKQQLKKPCFTTTKIIIGVAVFIVAAIAMYNAVSYLAPSKTETVTGLNHSKIISHASSSGQ